MRKYIISFAPHVGTHLENGAFVKPKRDIIESAKEIGYEEVLPLEKLHFNLYNGLKEGNYGKRLQRRLLTPLHVRQNINFFKHFFRKLGPDDVLFVQYPIYIELASELFVLFKREIANLKIGKKIILTHDIEAIQKDVSKWITSKDEIDFIKSFDHIIVHNEAMINYLKSDTDHNQYHSLNIFDYRVKSDNQKKLDLSIGDISSVFFAGNLMKANFLRDVDNIPDFSFNVYGPNFPVKKTIANLFHLGSLSADEIIEEGAKYSFGLVWDGDSIDGLSGNFGEYMKYNNPYKFSCNIASGLPIITSSKAGIARYIHQQNLGILVESLRDLNNIKLTKENYNVLKNNVLSLRKKIMNGEIIKELLIKIENM